MRHSHLTKHPLIVCSIGILVIMTACAKGAGSASTRLAASQVPIVKPKVVRTIAHDRTAFTQGLFFKDTLLYESTGIYEQSSLRVLRPSDGAVQKIVPVPGVFGEGIALHQNLIAMLTWRECRAIWFNRDDLSAIGESSYNGEGWGLTSDGNGLIMSNGSDTLFFRDADFKIKRTIGVTCNAKPQKQLNELEYVNGRIYANVWYDNRILEIDPANGRVTRIVDCSELTGRIGAPTSMTAVSARPGAPDVLNGIAYNPADSTFFLTGKLWPAIFVVRIPGR
jgi:glutamine cyclotransferase